MLDGHLNIIEKIFYKSFVEFNNIEKCFYKQKLINKAKRVILYLDYPKYIHLGDALWLEPIARLFAAYFDFAICCATEIEFYFRKLGYKIIHETQISENDLLVARTELAYHLKGRDVLWINFSYSRITEPLINSVLNNIADYLGVPRSTARPQALRFSSSELEDTSLKFRLDPDRSYAVLNNYIHSLKFGASKNDFHKAEEALLNFADIYRKNEKINIIHAGTAEQKINDMNIHDCVDLDLRGMTSVEDLFMISSMKNVVSYVGFDSFLLHLFNIYDKNSLIMLRPGFSQVLKKQIKEYVAVPYETDNKKVLFID